MWTPALIDFTIAMARFINTNYETRSFLALALLSLKHINTTECTVGTEFNSRALFRETTVSSSMNSIAYYCVLTSPNTIELETAEVDSHAAAQVTTEDLLKALKKFTGNPGLHLYSE